MDPKAIVSLHEQLVLTHGLTGFTVKVGMLALLILASRVEGMAITRLIAIVIAAQSAVWAALASGYSAERTGGSGGVWVVGVAGVLLMACSGITALMPEGRWRVLPAAGPPWLRWVVMGLYVWAFWFPAFMLASGPGAYVRALFTSPMGAIPHPTLIIALTLAWTSWPDTPRLFAWGAVLSGAIVGAIDVLGGGYSSMLILGLAGWVAWQLKGGTQRAGLLEDDRPPVDLASERKAREKSRSIDEEGRTGRRWKLK